MKLSNLFILLAVIPAITNAETGDTSMKMERSFGVLRNLPSCKAVQYKDTNRSIPEWFLTKAKELESRNPSYPAKTEMRYIDNLPINFDINMDFSIVNNRISYCESQVERFLKAAEKAVDENLKNSGKLGYVPYDISRFIQDAYKMLSE